MDIGSFEDPTATSIYGETVLVEYIIILEDVFAYIEVATFDLFLDRGDISHEGF
jgi:hypothetical protein